MVNCDYVLNCRLLINIPRANNIFGNNNPHIYGTFAEIRVSL